MLHQNEDVTQERGGSRVQEIEDPAKKNTKEITKVWVKKPQINTIEQI